MLKVCKFGGSSMADSGQFKKVKRIIESDSDRKVIVVSASGKRFPDDHKITDLLYLCYAHIKYDVNYESIFSMIKERYLEIKNELGLTLNLDKEFDGLLSRMKDGIGEDELVSRGEYFSAKLLAEYLGYDFLDSTLWVRFHIDGTVNKESSYEALKRLATGRKVVIPGFYGALEDGSIKTFSRGGSDITGALAAAALDADVYENWTDVSGFLMADPRIVENPESIERITYSELRELSYIGAKVLHEGSIFPVQEKNIPLNVRNTNHPEHKGTMIRESFDENALSDNRFITGIAGKKGFTAISITKNGISSTIGALSQILKIFGKYHINVEYLPSGIDSVSMVVSSEEVSKCIYQLMGDIQKEIEPDNIHVTENIAIVAAVGRKMAFKPGISGKIFATLGENGINIRMITQGPDELNIIVGVDNKDFENTIRVLYNSFVK